MPTYEYRCDNCGYKVDYFQSMKEPPKTICPQCMGHLSRMVTSGAGLIFNGTGFYITDYKHKNSFGGDNGKRRAGEKAAATAKPKEKAVESHKNEGGG